MLCPSCLETDRERQRYQNRRDRKLESFSRRVVAVALATPIWCDKSAIAAIYRECRRITAETGERHEVDHFYPIQGISCCGLHVAVNLRIIPMAANRSKSNVMPLDYSPATRAAIMDLDGVDGLRAQMLAI